eukprot:3236381-Pleurochrysis_carterae.AAC.1
MFSDRDHTKIDIGPPPIQDQARPASTARECAAPARPSPARPSPARPSDKGKICKRAAQEAGQQKATLLCTELNRGLQQRLAAAPNPACRQFVGSGLNRQSIRDSELTRALQRYVPAQLKGYPAVDPDPAVHAALIKHHKASLTYKSYICTLFLPHT